MVSSDIREAFARISELSDALGSVSDALSPGQSDSALPSFGPEDVPRLKKKCGIGFLDEACSALGAVCEILYMQTRVEGPGLTPAYMNLQENPGVKLNPQTTAAAIVPVGKPLDVSGLNCIVNPLTPYTDLAVYVLPREIERTYVSYSGGDYTNWDSVVEVLAYYQLYCSLIDSGRGIFLPSRFILHDETAFHSDTNLYQSPLVQSVKNFTYIPENPPSTWKGRPAAPDVFVYHKLLLPYFPGASLEKLAEVANRETDAFQLFTSYLSQKLGEVNDAESHGDLEDIIREIDGGVAKLRLDAKKLSKTKLLRGAQMSFFTVSLGALMLHNSQIVKEIAGLIGSMNVLQLFQGVIEQQKDQLELRKSEFFIPYLLSLDPPRKFE